MQHGRMSDMPCVDRGVMKLFLDLDGVIVNLEEPLAKHFGLTQNDYDITKWNGIQEALGHTSNKYFWSFCDYHFWINLPMYSHAIDLLSALAIYNPCLLTSPPAHIATAKQDWIQKNLPIYFRYGRYLIGPAKEEVAGPGKVLIDDHDENIDKWRADDGYAIVFPQPWNRQRKLVGVVDPVEYVMTCLKDIQKTLDKSEI